MIPTSWADDLNLYRSQRGCQSFSSVSKPEDVPKRFARTLLVPFADTKHPLYSYEDPICNATQSQGVNLERFRRHGEIFFPPGGSTA